MDPNGITAPAGTSTRLHGYGIRICRYGYVDTLIRQLQKIRIHQYSKYIYNLQNKYYEDNAQS
jgi:hypothetical protein